jgi:hypothetical protein
MTSALIMPQHLWKKAPVKPKRSTSDERVIRSADYIDIRRILPLVTATIDDSSSIVFDGNAQIYFRRSTLAA